LKVIAMQVDLYRREPPAHLGILGGTVFAARFKGVLPAGV
jgi:hypothetical protein